MAKNKIAEENKYFLLQPSSYKFIINTINPVVNSHSM